MILSLKVYHHWNTEKLVLLYTHLSSLNKTIPYDSLVSIVKTQPHFVVVNTCWIHVALEPVEGYI